MLHFVTSYMKQNKSRKQTLESAQNGLEIIFKFSYIFIMNNKNVIWIAGVDARFYRSGFEIWTRVQEASFPRKFLKYIPGPQK